MKSDMKTIMESWKSSKLLSEALEISTVGELRKAIRDYRAMTAGKEFGKKAVEMAIESTPLLGNVYNIWKGVSDAKEMVSKLYGAEDEVKSNTGMDRLNVDDNISKIVDDRIEQAFLNDLLKSIEKMDDDDQIPDVNEHLKNYLKTKFNRHAVEKS